MAGKLSALSCKTASIGKHSDGGGLYLQVTDKGKYWRGAYRFEGKQKTSAYGTYPAVSLAEARAKHAVFKQLLAQGIDPNAEKKATKQRIKATQQEADGTSPILFGNIATDWLETTNQAKQWTQRHYLDTKANIRNYIAPAFAHRRIDSITALEIIAHLKSIPYAYTAQCTLDNIKRIYRHAVNQQLMPYSPAELLRASELLPAHNSDPMRHLSEPSTIGRALLAIDRAPVALPATRAFLRLLPYLFTRPTELRALEWTEINDAGDLISIPPERMKKRRPHLIPLPIQAQSIIKEMRLYTGMGAYVFANTYQDKGKPITEGAAYKVMRSAKVGEASLHSLTTLHGWPKLLIY